jgi:integrase
MKLRAFVADYIGCHDLAASSAEQLTCFVNRLEGWRGSSLEVRDLTHQTINDYLRWAREQGYSDDTRRNRRTMFLTLADTAADDGLIEPIRRRKVMRVTLPERTPLAYTVEQAKKLLLACEAFTGHHSATGIRRRDFWRSYILAAWDTGLRGCDLRRLRVEQVVEAPDGRLVRIQHKTKKRIAVTFRDETIRALHRTLPPERALCWPLWGRLELFRREARLLVKIAGLPGSLKCLRSGSGTAVEIEAPGRGHEHLGNTRRVFERNYLDETQIESDRPLPPPIDTDEI